MAPLDRFFESNVFVKHPNRDAHHWKYQFRHHLTSKKLNFSRHHMHRFPRGLSQLNDATRRRTGVGQRLLPLPPSVRSSDLLQSGQTPPRVPGSLQCISRFLPLRSLGWSMPRQ